MITRPTRRPDAGEGAERFSPPFPVPAEANGPGALTPGDTLFVVVSFEGPDPYSQAGGLGVRVTGLVQMLASEGFETHLFFIGDPTRPGEERVAGGRMILHRWAQWISANCPGGVYDGEEGKVADITRSLPPYLVDRILTPAIRSGRIPVVIFEEWQTAPAAIAVADALAAAGLRDRAILVWNANNSYGFERIDWRGLAAAAAITTVSGYMRSVLRSHGADAGVVPNGISRRLLEPVSRRDVAPIRAAIDGVPGVQLAFKMARSGADKGWVQALRAVRELRTSSDRMLFVARSGGPGGAGATLAGEAETAGLRCVEIHSDGELLSRLPALARSDVDVVSLRFGVDPALARAMYAASQGVFANSIAEPFGLVALEAMAAGGVVYTGGTGEDYAVHGRNAVVLKSTRSDEIVEHWERLRASPDRADRIRRAARRTAREYAWDRVVSRVVAHAAEQARDQELIERGAPTNAA